MTDHARNAVLYARTARHLRPSQIGHRLRLRAQKAALALRPDLFEDRWCGEVPDPTEVGWPAICATVDERVGEAFPSAEANATGTFRFLAEERSLGDEHDWQQPGASQLWRYHLHYFEWAWSFATHPDHAWAREEFGRLWASWRASTRFGRWDEWSPYVVSLRAWALCGTFGRLLAGTAHERTAIEALALHAGFVARNLELDVGGNHLVKNLKALVGLGVFLRDDSLVELARRHLARQLAVQVLPDGGHFERSPSYHCQVLADLHDVGELLRSADLPPIAGLTEAVASMRQWLGDMLLPDGDVPLFNDCELVGVDRVAALAPSPPRPGRLVVLDASGYVVVRPTHRIHLVADIGPPCPPELPAHAHADCLSFELAVDGRRVVVDTGTSTYAGPRRAHERSTAAHNTVEVDGADQTEVWGRFRAGRRARPTLHRAEDDGEIITVAASHDGYERLPGRPRHRRQWRVSATTVDIDDAVTGAGEHTAVARVHLPLEVHQQNGIGLVATPDAEVEPAEVAVGHGLLRPAVALVSRLAGPLPLRAALHIEIDPEGGDR